jgi:DNA modification methylase
MQVTQVPIDSIHAYANNPRKNDGAVEAVVKSLREFGFRQPIVVDEANEIVVGHTRWRAAKELGMAEVPVHVARGLTQTQINAYRIADNQTATIAEWDKDLLALELSQLAAAEYDLSLLGFSAPELAKIEADGKKGQTDPDESPAPPKVAITTFGDVWVCGDHRVMCGSSLEADAVRRLVDEDLVQLIVTDPPYNVAYVGKTKDALTIKNDKMGDADFRTFLFEAFKTAFDIAADGAAVYVFHADSEGYNFRGSLIDAGFKLAQCCVWVKQSMVMGRQDYQWQHEPVLYGWKPTGSHNWYSDRKQTTVWKFDRPSKSTDHPTMKPVDLIKYPIENSSQAGDIVFDGFGGSGTTLIACEMTGRKARLMELDPIYCDVIVRRWEQFTGRTAVLEKHNGSERTEAITDSDAAGKEQPPNQDKHRRTRAARPPKSARVAG